MHHQLLSYELIHKKMNMREATEMYTEVLFKYDAVKSNLNSYFADKGKESNPGHSLSAWDMFGIRTYFSSKGKTPQYWIVGSSNVGKTYNIDTLEDQGHRAYLIPKNNDWSDWSDNEYDFMYNEETASDFLLTFLNQMLEGTRIKLNGKFVKSIIKKRNIPIILNSNHMPHMLYKNTDPYILNATLQRMYIIYVDNNKQSHIIWNPNSMNINQHINKFINNGYTIDSYDHLFSDEYENESANEKSYIKYLSTIQAENEEKEHTLRIHNEEVEIQEHLARDADTLDNRIKRTFEQAETFDKVEKWFNGEYVSDEGGYSSNGDHLVYEDTQHEYILDDSWKGYKRNLHLEEPVSESDSEYDRYGVPKDNGFIEFYAFNIEDRYLQNEIYTNDIDSEPGEINTGSHLSTAFEEEVNILNNIDLCGLYAEIPFSEPIDIKCNMNLCLEADCSNVAELNEDLCLFHLDEQWSDTESVVYIKYERYKLKENYLERPNY